MRGALCLSIVLSLVACSKEDPGNRAPTAVTLANSAVNEQAAPGTAVSVVIANDPDKGDTHTFALIEDQVSRFQLIGNELIVGPNGANLNFEAAPTHEIIIEATDQDGASRTETLTIDVVDLAEVTSLEDSGPGSLRVMLQNATEGDRLLFDNGLAGQINILSLISLAKNVTIEGPGAPNMTILGTGTFGLFAVQPGASVTLRGLTLSSGMGNFSTIESEGNLVLEDMIIRDSESFRGGCLRTQSTPNTVTYVRRTKFQNCRGFNGGAIAFDGGGTAFVNDSLFVDNSTTGNSGAGLLTDSGTTTIVNSTFYNNVTTGASRVGGGVAAFNNGTIEIRQSTIVNNTATGTGGGIFASAGALIILEASIVANNVGDPAAPQISAVGAITSQGYNVVDSDVGSGLTAAAGDQFNVVAMTGNLLDNGGPTETVSFTAGSPPHNGVPLSACKVTQDQRGVARPQGADCDVGAFELE